VIAHIWEELLKIVEQEVGNHVVQTWLKAVTFKGWSPQEGVAYLEVPNQFVRSWIQSNYQMLLEIHLARLLTVPTLKITFVNGSQEAPKSSVEARPIVPAVATCDLEPIQNPVLFEPGLGKRRAPINQAYLFDTFVVGPSNQLAYAAAHAVTEKPGKLYNPLFIYGGSGLGKTHLLHAIGNEVRERNKRLEVLYQPADRFVSDFIGAIRFDKVHQFKSRYNAIDILLIDDVQFISNKEQTQEIFFHIFNMLYESRKQIVFSSDTDPAGINGLAERLRSRFEWGLVADIGLPTVETKIVILQKKASSSNQHITEDIIHYIASLPMFNIRELEGALIRINAYAALTNQPVTLDLAKKVLMRTKTTQETTLGFKHIVKSVQKHCEVSLANVRSSKRTKDIVFARQVAMYLMKKLTNRSLEQIGEFFGGKDHSTVLHAITKIEQHMAQDKEVELLIATIEDELLR
jgi:chromosomal replication initiator protein